MEEALGLLQKGTRRGSSPILDNALAIVLARLGQVEQAAFFAQRAAAGAPESSDILITLGNVLFMLDRNQEAGAAFERALSIRPDNQRARVALANVRRLSGRPTEASRLLEDAERQVGAEAADAAATRIAALMSLARVEEAWGEAELAAAAHPDSVELCGQRANLANYVPGLSIDDDRRAHARFGALLERTMPRRAREFRLARDPGRALRVGFLSADLRRHSAAYFLEPLLEELGRHSIGVYCYALHARDDEVSARLRRLAQQWRGVAWLSDAEIVERIVDDRIDVLVDLMGHTERARQGVLHRRAAPVQVGYLGYPNITGVSQMDARLVDRWTDPPGADDAGPEMLVRLDGSFLCFRAPRDAPEPLLDDPARPFTFGSFNAAAKLNGRVLAVWAEILKAAPRSRLLLKARSFEDPALARELPSRLAALGVAPERIEIAPPAAGTREHLAMYARVDVALDTFPYNGTTTTCEALWQGVPVVTLAGDRHAARVGVSLLTSAGLPGWIADDARGYVELAVRGSASGPRTEEARRQLRAQVASSALCDAGAMARRFSAAIRERWSVWCGTAAS